MRHGPHDSGYKKTITINTSQNKILVTYINSVSTSHKTHCVFVTKAKE